MLPKGTFVLGGAASGKSEWAENLTLSFDQRAVYLATGRAQDSETSEKVRIHQARRDTRWQTIEEPLELSQPLSGIDPSTPVLIDCATMWLSNHMMAASDLSVATDALLAGLRSCPAPWVIVSNEVGHGIVPDNKLARQFRDAQGRLNLALAREAELAVQIIAGLPQVLKGTLP
ncbi:bifunctional adenosylcobinamide kinase/adenosylcobinamide-phosphate guanylyltransferase [Sulfitobacter donghicola]|uniref:Bifunctional adenosylcobalamin biosynthesis protein n=1 Tax=Sulfitobacter donghicola DSW-25 = KCTC 12864 = JCM 14565 TaxID=1300350 RepID=A0A073IFI0_9RHOB|nr:bifunctional adenosylcobinamide kinase/adenosylcobinamide-phosphate guanylyltransferase [Sulfitobacter donghicola]KEJ89088.1 adenosylcobinamide kinase [Sulfitobacter donghicola DSW-25 = KCTC 12864 = JCM 14565]KIN67336.1 Bifunctional adenosylcobalamin biosynthesis protein CobP [Sulfitobacter donghicola DSW-25 = KCTC 12864 = JCM 14565]